MPSIQKRKKEKSCKVGPLAIRRIPSIPPRKLSREPWLTSSLRLADDVLALRISKAHGQADSIFRHFLLQLAELLKNALVEFLGSVALGIGLHLPNLVDFGNAVLPVLLLAGLAIELLAELFTPGLQRINVGLRVTQDGVVEVVRVLVVGLVLGLFVRFLQLLEFSFVLVDILLQLRNNLLALDHLGFGGGDLFSDLALSLAQLGEPLLQCSLHTAKSRFNGRSVDVVRSLLGDGHVHAWMSIATEMTLVAGKLGVGVVQWFLKDALG
ncbi:hypothetical protein IWX90DRAFT_45974 [Phyllosticta citrichinensis]|uniref:Uncharacterized protein n=1 Tax=Phyllosticta citrichinensis TaxID=1130410 RepID=A0ABR1XHV9_9PEZI